MDTSKPLTPITAEVTIEGPAEEILPAAVVAGRRLAGESGSERVHRSPGETAAALFRVPSAGASEARDRILMRLRGPSARMFPRQTTVPVKSATNHRTPRAELSSSSSAG